MGPGSGTSPSPTSTRHPAPGPSKVSVVVVSYNTCDKLRRCLSCIEAEHEVIVVDNASTDGSVEMIQTEFPAAKLIENSGNVGFGAANNQGMDLATRDLVLFLNSDCYASPGSIATLAAAFSDPKVIATGGRLLNPDGSLQESVAGPLTLWAVFLEQTYLERFAGSKSYWRTPRFCGTAFQAVSGSGFRPKDQGQDGPGTLRQDAGATIPVDQVMGACMMIRPVEKFDERFFLYCEDTDLCLRLRKHGSIVYVPTAVFTHELGSSSLGASRWLSVARYNRGKELYFAIHWGWFACAICWKLDRLGALLRLTAYCVLNVITLFMRPQWRQMPLLWLRVLTVSPRGPDRPPRRAG